MTWYGSVVGSKPCTGKSWDEGLVEMGVTWVEIPPSNMEVDVIPLLGEERGLPTGNFSSKMIVSGTGGHG